MSFYHTVSIIAIVILSIVLIIFGVMIYNSKFNIKFPPVTPQCPDYWETISDPDGGNMCYNVKNLGNKSCQKKIDFASGQWTGVGGMCNKQQWTRRCHQVWDGVTNAPDAC